MAPIGSGSICYASVTSLHVMLCVAVLITSSMFMIATRFHLKLILLVCILLSMISTPFIVCLRVEWVDTLSSVKRMDFIRGQVCFSTLTPPWGSGVPSNAPRYAFFADVYASTSSAVQVPKILNRNWDAFASIFELPVQSTSFHATNVPHGGNVATTSSYDFSLIIVFFSVAACLFISKRVLSELRHRSGTCHLCKSCGYPVVGLQRCPECGVSSDKPQS